MSSPGTAARLLVSQAASITEAASAADTPGERGPDKDALRVLRADPGNEAERDNQRAENRAQGIGGIDAAHGPPGVLTGARQRGHGQRKTRAPQDGGR